MHMHGTVCACAMRIHTCARYTPTYTPHYLRGSQHRSQHGEEVREEGEEEDEGSPNPLVVDETHTDADHVATRRRRQTKRAPRPRRACRAGRDFRRAVGGCTG